MEIKKNPQASLENYSKQFLLLGLVLTLFSTHVALEHKTYDVKIADFDTVSLTADTEEELVITKRVDPVKPPPPPPPKVLEIIEVVKDDELIEETIVESTETDENDAVIVDIDDIQEETEGEEIFEDVPFAVIENAPVFPGCEKGNKEEQRACFSKKVDRHIKKKFNSNLAGDLGLSSGKKRIFVMFTIDKHGGIVDIQARAPHPRLQKEAVRVVNTLPKMIPGKQRGMPVNVKYSLPISFMVVDR